MSCCIKLCILILLIHSNVAVYLVPKQLLTRIGSSYTVMLVADDENIKPKQCYLKEDHKSYYQINLTTPGVPLEPNDTVSQNEENTNILTSLGYGICGFKLDNVGTNYVSKWNISFIDENDFFYYKNIDIFLRDIKLENETKYVTVGDEFAIKCGDVLSPNYLLSCQLYDPQGRLILIGDRNKDCNHYVKTSKISDFGEWKCILQLENDIFQRNIYYNIVEKEKNAKINLWQKETNMHVNIGCAFKNVKFDSIGMNRCEMVRPDGETFSLMEGLATDRYTALGTNISNGICGMEIRKPLEDFEKGLWRCQFKFVDVGINKYPIGGFINLSNGSALPPLEIPKKIVTLVNEKFFVSCSVPYSSSYCYMRGPNKTIHPVENQLEPTLGLCRFTKVASLLDNGTWSCDFAKETGQVDAQYSFEVHVLEYISVNPEETEVNGTIGDTAYLKCSTKHVDDYPIQYCRFQDPFGQIYNVDPEENFTNRISYYGRGLKYGDCGIQIKNVFLSDAGTWTCITRIGVNFRYPETYSEIKLQII